MSETCTHGLHVAEQFQGWDVDALADLYEMLTGGDDGDAGGPIDIPFKCAVLSGVLTAIEYFTGRPATLETTDTWGTVRIASPGIRASQAHLAELVAHIGEGEEVTA